MAMAERSPDSTLMADLCLAPGGICACAQNGSSGAKSDAWSACWRVRVPWWTASPTLLPDNRFSQLLRSDAVQGSGLRSVPDSLSGGVATIKPSSSSSDAAQVHDVEGDIDRIETRRVRLNEQAQYSQASARARTPSPEQNHYAFSTVLPPKLLFAPPVPLPASGEIPASGRPLPSRTSLKETGLESTVSPAVEHVDRVVESDAGGHGQERRRRHRRKGAEIQVATVLKSLENVDPQCVFQVRNIQALGFESPELLRSHFEAYGEVEEIFLSNAHEKSPDLPTGNRLRPSGMAFIKMFSADDAQRIIAEGEHHVVAGSPIVVRKFQQRERAFPAPGGNSQDV